MKMNTQSDAKVKHATDSPAEMENALTRSCYATTTMTVVTAPTRLFKHVAVETLHARQPSSSALQISIASPAQSYATRTKKEITMLTVLTRRMNPPISVRLKISPAQVPSVRINVKGHWSHRIA